VAGDVKLATDVNIVLRSGIMELQFHSPIRLNDFVLN
jgi:hypothetical protein